MIREFFQRLIYAFRIEPPCYLDGECRKSCRYYEECWGKEGKS